MGRTRIPDGARHLTTYAELESYLKSFIANRYPFLWIVGRPGIGKSKSIEAVTSGRPVYYRDSAQLTPAALYDACYRFRGRHIILDDVEDFLKDPLGAKIIAALGNTTPVKKLSWNTRLPIPGGIPSEFTTTSSLAILSNRPTVHKAIQSRAVILYFDPTNIEVHKAATRWFWDQEIHDRVGRHLQDLPGLEFRWYFHASCDRKDGRDWQQLLLKTHAPDNMPSIVVQDLETDLAYQDREDKVQRFTELTGLSRPTYFRLRKKLIKEERLHPEVVPPMCLRVKKPPRVPTLAELDALAANPPTPTEDEPTTPPDLPAHDHFGEPVCGQAPSPQPARGPHLDDTLSWEKPPQDDEQDEDEE